MKDQLLESYTPKWSYISNSFVLSLSYKFGGWIPIVTRIGLLIHSSFLLRIFK